MKQLFGDLPYYFESEEELRGLWGMLSTRKKLLEELEGKGYSQAELESLYSLIHGEDSDLFDVLNHVAYHRELIPRFERASRARVQINDYNPNQQEFLNFILDQYVAEGFKEQILISYPFNITEI